MAKPKTDTKSDPAGPAFWSMSADALCGVLETSPRGLSSSAAAASRARYGSNRLSSQRPSGTLVALLSQFRNPLVLILIGAATLSLFLGDAINAGIILVIVGLSSGLGFWQERGAHDAVARLSATVQVRSSVRRDGQLIDCPVDEIVPGDVVELSAGSTVPGDGLILEANSLFLDEAALTGESLPVAKGPGRVATDAPIARRTNALFMGTHLVSGTATMVVVAIGSSTQFGEISRRLHAPNPETEFERGLRLLGAMLTQVTLAMLAAVFGLNVFLNRPLIDSFLFALALAVGITPQLLPAIVTINLSRGARQMAEARVIVRRLFAIENFGRMDVLCCDKTGTLTEGTVAIKGALGADGAASPAALRAARINATFESGFINPIDHALRDLGDDDLAACRKLGEVPYDFVRKRLSILCEEEGHRRLITKGALPNVLDICVTAITGNSHVAITEACTAINALAAKAARDGFRVLAVAERMDPPASESLSQCEREMAFLGLLLLRDPLKPDAAAATDDLAGLGVSLKVISGDSRMVTARVMEELIGRPPILVTGEQVHHSRPEGLRRLAQRADCFAEIEPAHKERIVRALRASGHVVGFMGDGINDAAALHAADVGISVDTAVDVAKEAADLVLLDRSLSVIGAGIREGRITYANTLKYVFMAVGTNLGNVFSMAIASLIFPFLPMLPKQILLANLLTDLPAMTISTDRVDAELVEHPRRWSVRWIRQFMWVFGPLSSVFDLLTFAVLVWIYHADPVLFRSAWFMESVVSAVLIVLVLRTRRRVWQSRPSRYLLGASLLIVGVVLVLPVLPFAPLLGLEPLPTALLFAIVFIVAAYAAAVEIAKRVFYGVVAD